MSRDENYLILNHCILPGVSLGNKTGSTRQLPGNTRCSKTAKILKKGGVSCQDLIVKYNLNKTDLSITFCYLTPLQVGGFLKKKIKSLKKIKMAENKNELGKDFKEQTWYSNFLKKTIEKIQARLSFKRKSLKDLENKYGRISENLKGMTVHMSNGRNNHEQFKLIKEIGFGTFGVVYSAKRLSDKKEVCSLYIPYQ